MPRVKRGFKARRRRNKVLKKAKGYYAARHRLVRTAMEAVDKALQHAYVGRKLKKRDFRALWQTRISAAAKANGTSFSKFMGGLKKKGSLLDRKVLSEIAVRYPQDFAAMVEWSKAN
ncbi:MAG TPA: 50S ribosomal protein L20 [bacterium]|nr:50S ribosomal protein L20 [bacterium]